MSGICIYAPYIYSEYGKIIGYSYDQHCTSFSCRCQSLSANEPCLFILLQPRLRLRASVFSFSCCCFFWYHSRERLPWLRHCKNRRFRAWKGKTSSTPTIHFHPFSVVKSLLVSRYTCAWVLFIQTYWWFRNPAEVQIPRLFEGFYRSQVVDFFHEQYG